MTETEGLVLAGGVIGGSIGIIVGIAIVIYILLIIAWWKIFKKAGQAGWKSIIPIYNVYILCKITKINFWICFLLIPVVIGILNALVFKDNQSISSLISGVYTLVIEIVISYRLAKAFGKGIGYTLGLIFLPNIFTLILGFGSAKYVGIKD